MDGNFTRRYDADIYNLANAEIQRNLGNFSEAANCAGLTAERTAVVEGVHERSQAVKSLLVTVDAATSGGDITCAVSVLTCASGHIAVIYKSIGVGSRDGRLESADTSHADGLRRRIVELAQNISVLTENGKLIVARIVHENTQDHIFHGLANPTPAPAPISRSFPTSRIENGKLVPR